jgi:hypothetical protein
LLVLNGSLSKMTLAEQQRNGGGGATFDALAMAGLVRGRWVQVTIDLDQSTKPQTVSASFDGAPFATVVPLNFATPSADGHLAVGSTYASAGPATSFAADDVMLVLAP